MGRVIGRIINIFSGSMKHKLMCCGTFGESLTRFWKDIEPENDVIISYSELLSFFYLFTGVDNCEILVHSISINKMLRGIYSELILVMNMIKEVAEIKAHVRVTTSDALKYAEELEKSIESTSEKSSRLRLLLDEFKTEYGKSGLRTLIIRMMNTDVNVKPTGMYIIDALSNYITDIGSFGITRYIIISSKEMDDNTVMYDGVFNRNEHPFRLVPDGMMRIRYDQIRTFNLKKLTQAINNGVCIDVMCGYDLNIIYEDSKLTLGGVLNTNPLEYSQGVISIKRFSVSATVDSLECEEYVLYKLSRPEYKVYVEPRNDFTSIFKRRVNMCKILFSSCHIL